MLLLLLQVPLVRFRFVFFFSLSDEYVFDDRVSRYMRPPYLFKFVHSRMFFVSLLFFLVCFLRSPFPPPAPPPFPLFSLSPSILRLFITFDRNFRDTYMLAALVAVPFGDGQHFVQLAGGTNDRTAPKLLELGLIGNRQQASKRLSLLHIIFFKFTSDTACFSRRVVLHAHN